MIHSGNSIIDRDNKSKESSHLTSKWRDIEFKIFN